MSEENRLSRRGFLKVAGPGIMALFVDTSPGVRYERDLDINERISEIVSIIRPVGFDSQGNIISLLKNENNGESDQLSVITTERSAVETTIIPEVKLLVVHYDAGERYRLNGIERNAANTVNGLNGCGASVHWCIDNFPIRNNPTGEGGYGILQTQEASGDPLKPLMGHHVTIVSSEIDPNRSRTCERFGNLGIHSNLFELVERDERNFNLYTVGYEQIGTMFEERFPSDWEPPRLQFANTVSLCIAAMRQFSLTPWDIVGHNEIQQKSDPGDYHMATLRFILGIAALEELVPHPLVFKGGSVIGYFENVHDYLGDVDRYGIISEWEDFVGYNAFMQNLQRSVHRNERGVIGE